MYEYDFIIGKYQPNDPELFFGPDPIPIRYMDATTGLPEILVLCGIFKSKSDARRNGWDRPIEPGWNQYRVGKKKIHICILKEFYAD